MININMLMPAPSSLQPMSYSVPRSYDDDDDDDDDDEYIKPV
jgi:hypothetical protein